MFNLIYKILELENVYYLLSKVLFCFINAIFQFFCNPYDAIFCDLNNI